MSKINLTCRICNKDYQVYLGYHNQCKAKGLEMFCSKSCYRVSKVKPKKEIICKQCNSTFIQPLRSTSKFCSQSCSATYNNTHKKTGTRVSKLEKFIQQKLTEKYSFEIHFNRKDAINSELDIYIPSLKLAFELNGIFHYEPIYGADQLSKIQNNDNRKFQACLERGIELCIIDTSKQKRFTESSCNQYIDIIDNIIKLKQRELDLAGVEPACL